MLAADGAAYRYTVPSFARNEEFLMAGTSLLALLDDIASVLDDVALMTKVVVNKRETFFGKTFLTDIRDL
ncbi:MAG: hypothetical protein ACRC91_17170 [Aeromonas sp.]